MLFYKILLAIITILTYNYTNNKHESILTSHVLVYLQSEINWLLLQSGLKIPTAVVIQIITNHSLFRGQFLEGGAYRRNEIAIRQTAL